MYTSLTSRQILKLPDAGHLLLITGGPELLKIIRREAGAPPGWSAATAGAGALGRAGSAALPAPLIHTGHLCKDVARGSITSRSFGIEALEVF